MSLNAQKKSISDECRQSIIESGWHRRAFRSAFFAVCVGFIPVVLIVMPAIDSFYSRELSIETTFVILTFVLFVFVGPAYARACAKAISAETAPK